AALLVALPNLAMAADLPTLKAPPAPPPIFSWTGVYAGSSFGYTFSTLNESAYNNVWAVPGALTGPAAHQQSYSPRGVYTDFHLGYLKQFSNNLVLGGEFDVGWSPANTSKTLVNGVAAAMPGGATCVAGAPAGGSRRGPTSVVGGLIQRAEGVAERGAGIDAGPGEDGGRGQRRLPGRQIRRCCKSRQRHKQRRP
ncbi:MAG TPA: hypothetical protein VED87_11530, partial [Methylocystis sp.]|nr:hypothetical protein [Methylocystis sp.]